jgi:tetratricopeptide (TPR) repeat protein
MRTPGPAWILLGLAGIACVPDRESNNPEPEAETRACTGADRFARVWNPSTRAELEGALEQIPGEWPKQLLATLDARMPEFGDRWTQSYEQACERDARAVKGCLVRRAWELDAVFALIIEEPERTAALWSELEGGAIDPRSCEQERGDGPPLLDDVRGRELASLAPLLELQELARVHALVAELEADPVVASTPSYALPVALARARAANAEDRREAADQALARAEAQAEQLDPRARVAVADTRALLAHARGDVEATTLAREQAVTRAREQADPWLLVAQLGELGRSLIERGEAARAMPPAIEAIGLAGRVGGADNPKLAELQTILAQAQLELGQVEAAHDALTQARDAFVIALGPDHPQTLATVEAVGRLFVAAGRLGDAQFAFLDLLEIHNELYGLKDWRTARIKLELADSLMAMDQHEGARTLYAEALTPLAQELGPVHPDVVRASIHLGIAELALGDLEAAEPHCRRGRDLAKGLATGSPLADEAERCLTQIEESLAASKKKPKKNR